MAPTNHTDAIDRALKFAEPHANTIPDHQLIVIARLGLAACIEQSKVLDCFGAWYHGGQSQAGPEMDALLAWAMRVYGPPKTKPTRL